MNNFINYNFSLLYNNYDFKILYEWHLSLFIINFIVILSEIITAYNIKDNCTYYMKITEITSEFILFLMYFIPSICIFLIMKV